MKKFIYTKDSFINGKIIKNDAVNMDLVSCFFKKDWYLKDSASFDINFKMGKYAMSWSFSDKIERDRVFDEIKEDFSYEI